MKFAAWSGVTDLSPAPPERTGAAPHDAVTLVTSSPLSPPQRTAAERTAPQRTALVCRAAIRFCEGRPDRVAIIGSLEKAPEAVKGASGTRIHY